MEPFNQSQMMTLPSRFLTALNGESDKCLKYYSLASEDGLAISQLWARALLLMEDLLHKEAKPVPWPVSYLYQ